MENEVEKVNYEVSFLVKEEASTQEVVKLLSQHGAEVISEGPLRKISLAYKINKETHAFFGFYYFQAEPASVKLLEQDLTRSSLVIRFLLLKVPSRKDVEA